MNWPGTSAVARARRVAARGAHSLGTWPVLNPQSDCVDATAATIAARTLSIARAGLADGSNRAAADAPPLDPADQSAPNDAVPASALASERAMAQLRRIIDVAAATSRRISDSRGRHQRRLASARSWAAARSSGWTCLRGPIRPRRSVGAKTASCLRSLWPRRQSTRSASARNRDGRPESTTVTRVARGLGRGRRSSARVVGPSKNGGIGTSNSRSPERSPPPARRRGDLSGWQQLSPEAAERWRESYAAEASICM